jgi:hypothetical protein
VFRRTFLLFVLLILVLEKSLNLFWAVVSTCKVTYRQTADPNPAASQSLQCRKPPVPHFQQQEEQQQQQQQQQQMRGTEETWLCLGLPFYFMGC